MSYGQSFPESFDVNFKFLNVVVLRNITGKIKINTVYGPHRKLLIFIFYFL